MSSPITQPRTFDQRLKDLAAERIVHDPLTGRTDIYGHLLDGSSAWLTVHGMDRAERKIQTAIVAVAVQNENGESWPTLGIVSRVEVKPHSEDRWHVETALGETFDRAASECVVIDRDTLTSMEQMGGVLYDG